MLLCQQKCFFFHATIITALLYVFFLLFKKMSHLIKQNWVFNRKNISAHKYWLEKDAKKFNLVCLVSLIAIYNDIHIFNKKLLLWIQYITTYKERNEIKLKTTALSLYENFPLHSKKSFNYRNCCKPFKVKHCFLYSNNC